MFKVKRIACLLITLIMTLSILQTTTFASDLTITKVKSFNYQGKFYMSFQVQSYNQAKVTAILINSAGKTVLQWKPLLSSSQNNPVVTFGENYDKLPAGQYTMVVTGELLGISPKTTATLKATIKNNPQATLSILDEAMCRIDSTKGYGHSFRFNFTQGLGKTVALQIYTAKGQLLKTNQYQLKNASGTYKYVWDYFPDNGLRVSGGNYIVKYKIGDGAWQQRQFAVQF